MEEPNTWPSQYNIHECLCKKDWCVSQHGLNSVEKISEHGHQPSSSASMYFFVQGWTGGALAEPYKTYNGLLICTFQTKVSETESMMLAWGLNIPTCDLVFTR